MSVTAVVGAQWGDEGKGRIIDYLAQQADVVIRFQGGDNAGHTVVNEYGKHALHLVPSGIFNPNTKNIIGSGCVVNPQALLEEMNGRKRRVLVSKTYGSARAQMLMPYHRELMCWRKPPAARIPSVRLSADRPGLCRQGGSMWAAHGRSAASGLAGDAAGQRPTYGKSQAGDIGRSPSTAINLCDVHGLSPTAWRAIVDTLPIVRQAISAGEEVMLEGQLGVMRDLTGASIPM